MALRHFQQSEGPGRGLLPDPGPGHQETLRRFVDTSTRYFHDEIPRHLQLIHLGHAEGHDGVVVVDGILHDQTVGSLLLV